MGENNEKLIDEFVVNVVNSMTDKLDETELRKLKDTLYIQFMNYDIGKKSTELSVCDDENMIVLKAFLSAKLIEGKSEATITRYKDMLVMMLDRLNKKYTDITTNDLRCYLVQYKMERNVQDSTLDGMRRIISSFFNWLADEDYIVKSPAVRLKKIKSEKKVKKILTDEELEVLKMNCKCERDIAIIEILSSTGIRVSECSKLNISDIDFVNKEIIVRGKGNKQRKVYFGGRTLVHLKKYLESRDDNNEALFVSMRKNIETNEYNRLTKIAIEVRLRKLGKSCNIDHVFPHRFRSTCATSLMRRGMPLQDVSTILGHAQLETTKIYCVLEDYEVKQSYQRYSM